MNEQKYEVEITRGNGGKGYCFGVEVKSNRAIFIHVTDVDEHKELRTGDRVECRIDWNPGGRGPRAFQVKLLKSPDRAPAKNPEIPYETQPIVSEPAKVVAIGGQGIATPLAAKSLAFNSARTTKRAPTPQAKAILSGDEQNIRPRGTTPPSKLNDEGGAQ
jgi:cold shock CspA family protein